MNKGIYVAEANERPRVRIDRSIFNKSKDEKVMVKAHKSNIKKQCLEQTGTTRWKPQHCLTFTF